MSRTLFAEQLTNHIASNPSLVKRPLRVFATPRDETAEFLRSCFDGILL